MKKSAEKETLINSLARKVGRAAGTIAKATQGLAKNAAAIVQTDKPRGKPRQKSGRRSTAKKKTRTAKPFPRKSGKRSSHKTD